MNSILKREIENTFLQAIVDLKDKNEIQIFLKDFLGESKYEKLVNKLAVIYWLRKERSLENIKNNLNVTDRDIVEAKVLMTKKGVKLAIKYMEAEEWANLWAEKISHFKNRV